ncbi:methylenetetrahydrofolate reductase [Stackebrandtia nassauensis]|uniref:Methylenetetrahydrofolate reductase n=1 Tax=Stackebrandtia nassauensis (strain DSM 44728 / CIP 108903 / NRRL B-16338 / NBRC 102104 / LLR-40K-21) TaxID=446470 RepID=D3PYE8_STANL|nr:methylenetetrahydrofolate reductase [Stackebrandtia nassauensis]ADD41515.1 methylenetetrahydrofolate reductase [Stackebrandtia nassauensis DSM 44728]
MSMSAALSRVRMRRTASRLLAEPRFEVLPLERVDREVAALPRGTTVTITASPSRGTMATVETAERFAALGLRPVPHLSARGMRDDAELVEVVQRLDHAGIRDAFVVGGDASSASAVFPDGLALLQAMDDIGHRLHDIGIPAYPEGHPSIDDDTLWAALAAKRRYATYAVTQLCFDAEAICRFTVQARQRGFDLPILAGIPGAVDTAKLLRVGLRIGIGDSLRFVRGNRSVLRKLLRPGGYRPDGLVRKLDGRVRDGRCELAGAHIYTFNDVAATARWLKGRTAVYDHAQ